MKKIDFKHLCFTITTVALLSSCNIDQKRKAELPDVDMDVSVEEGTMPKFDIDWAKVDVGMKTKMVKVPKVVIVMEEEEIEVPYIDIDMPKDSNTEDVDHNEKLEQNIIVEAEVTDNEHELDIKEIRATGSTLYVISELKRKETTIGDKKLRVSDQISLNAPDLNIKHYIVGERPDRVFNTQYKYFATLEDAKSNIANAKVIYTE